MLVLDLDDDGDGIPDSVEIELGFNPLEDDAGDDLDGDGMSNLREWKLGTDPIDPSSFNANTTYDPQTTLADAISLSNQNLTVSFSGGEFDWVRGFDTVSSGKHYWEATVACGPDSAGLGFGVIDASAPPPLDENDHVNEWLIGTDGLRKIHNGVAAGFPDGSPPTNTGDVIQIALDMNARAIFYGKNGAWLGEADPSSGVNPAFADLPAEVYAVLQGINRECDPLESTTNFGGSDFSYLPPFGFYKGYCPEGQCETSSADNDSDGDGVNDGIDAFPLDSLESDDTDLDGIGNNADNDDDNDGVEDNSDAFPEDPAASVDTDGDGQPDDWNADATEDQIANSMLILDLDDADDSPSVGGLPLYIIKAALDAANAPQP